MTNNAAERALRAVAVGRRNWTFAGSDEGGRRAACPLHAHCYCQAQRRRPQAWLADVLAHLPDYPAKRIGNLLPWNWHAEHRAAA
jgi:transposase